MELHKLLYNTVKLYSLFWFINLSKIKQYHITGAEVSLYLNVSMAMIRLQAQGQQQSGQP